MRVQTEQDMCPVHSVAGRWWECCLACAAASTYVCVSTARARSSTCQCASPATGYWSDSKTHILTLWTRSTALQKAAAVKPASLLCSCGKQPSAVRHNAMWFLLY